MRMSAVALVGVAALWACGPTGQRLLTETLPECPHDYSSVRVNLDGDDRIVQPRLAGPGATRDIPEYHDCQRFVVHGDQLEYDSLFAVFRTGQSLEVAPSVAVPVTEVLAWGDYDPLGLNRGQNCLYMWRATGPPAGPPEWRARMVYMANWGQVGTLACAKPVQVDSLPPGRDLDVVATDRGLAPGAYPKVARWGWNRDEALQTIHLDCLAAWCQVLPSGAHPTPSYYEEVVSKGKTPPSGAIRHRYRVSGWYDEQLLAYDPDPDDSSNPPVPTGILGRFFPHAELGSQADFRPKANATWTLVGYISLDVPANEPDVHAQKYFDTYGLKPTPGSPLFDEMNKLFLCNGSPRECEVLDTVKPCPADDPYEEFEWWARVEAPDGTSRERCVTRRAHQPPSPDVPATARWRWSIKDEGAWERCVQGCCEMIGDGEE